LSLFGIALGNSAFVYKEKKKKKRRRSFLEKASFSSLLQNAILGFFSAKK